MSGTHQGGSDGVDGDFRAYLVSYPSSLLGLSLTGICVLKLLITREAESQEEVLLMLEGGAAGRVKGLALETLWAYHGH